MGVFMASVAFRCEDQANWQRVKPEILGMLRSLDGLTHNLDSKGADYAIVSPYGDVAMPGFAEKVSALVEGYAVQTNCCDSDFNLLELYHNGELLDKCYVGECFEDYDEMGEYGKPELSKWLPLLADKSRLPELEQALGEVDVFAEDNLRLLSELTGLPIFDDELVFGLE